jgi:hypothetical protein
VKEQTTWREKWAGIPWPEAREQVLEANPLETVNLPEWKQLWEQCQEVKDELRDQKD